MYRFTRPLLIVAFGMETFCSTYGLGTGHNAPLAGVLYFLSGISIAFLSILMRPAKLPTFRPGPGVVDLSAKLVCTAGMMAAIYIMARYWFDQIPIDLDYADMLPVIRVMNQRFIEGHWRMVYDPIATIWNGAVPIYLPAMWLPYSLSLLMPMDMRWITAGALFFSFAAFLWTLRIHKQGVYPVFLAGIALMLFCWLLNMNDLHGLLSLSEEGVVVFYYVLAVFSLLSGNIIFISLAVCLCLFSRYAMIGWIPAFLLFMVWKKQYRQIRIFLLICTSVCLFCVVIPFGPAAFVRLLHLPGSYVSFAGRVWTDSPEVFRLGLGFAKFFGPTRVLTLHFLLIGLSFAIPVLFVIFCVYRSRKAVLNNVPLAAFKLSIVVFYNFIDVPYLYLFYTSVFVSLIMVSALTSAGSRPPVSGR
jgi:hypothetical protein